MVAEAEAAQGPWALIHHNLTGMAQPSPQWAATAYTDPHSGKSFVYAFNWIRETDAAALNVRGWAPPHPHALLWGREGRCPALRGCFSGGFLEDRWWT